MPPAAAAAAETASVHKRTAEDHGNEERRRKRLEKPIGCSDASGLPAIIPIIRTFNQPFV